MSTGVFTDAQIVAEAQSQWPEVAALSSAQLTAHTPLARSLCGTSYAPRQLYALGLALSHVATLVYGASGGASGTPVASLIIGGAVLSASDGDESISYGSWTGGGLTLSIADTMLAQTRPGQLLLTLRQTRYKTGTLPLAV